MCVFNSLILLHLIIVKCGNTYDEHGNQKRKTPDNDADFGVQREISVSFESLTSDSTEGKKQHAMVKHINIIIPFIRGVALSFNADFHTSRIGATGRAAMPNKTIRMAPRLNP